MFVGKIPLYKDHLRKLGVRNNDYFSLNGRSYWSIRESVKEVIGDRKYLSMLKSSPEIKNRLEALDYIENNLDWEKGPFGHAETQLRDALVTVFREDWSPQVRARAAEVIAKTLYSTFRSRDREAIKTVRGAVFTEDSDEVKLAIIRTGLLESWDLVKIADDTLEDIQVREDALYALVGELYFNWQEIAEKALVRIATSKDSERYPTRLKATVVGLDFPRFNGHVV